MIQYPYKAVTGMITGTASDVLYDFPPLDIYGILIVAHPSNTKIAWLSSKPGNVGYPLQPISHGGESVYVDDVANTNTLQVSFEQSGDAVCYIAFMRNPFNPAYP